MKLQTLIALTAILAVVATVQRAEAQPQVVSIVLSGANQTNTVQIASFQYAKILTATDADTSAQTTYYYTSFGQLTLGTSPAIAFNIPHRPTGDLMPDNGNGIISSAQSLAGVTVAGPGSISVTTGNNSNRNGPVLVTLEILPSAYSVTNSVTLGPGQGAAINLEGSTDLVNWSPTTNGVYTAPSAMFFRLHLQRLQ
jgi:hypothetical protein